MSQTILPFSDKPFLDKSGIQLPDLSPKTQHVTFELLQKNHKNFDMFINEQRFHNHLVHHLLAAYSLGASEQHLNEIYKLHTTMLSLKPRKPKQITITKENWTEFLGQYDLWGDYVDFFDKVVKEEGMEKAVNEYAFHPLVFPRLFARIFHPVIHLGCGVEFQIPMVVSEALAKTAVHPFDFADILTGDYFSFKANEKQSAMDIILKISRNEKFNNCWKFATESTEKSCPTHLVIEKDLQFIDVKAEDVRNIAKHWTVLETEEGVQKATQELYEACVLVYGATTIRPNTKKIYLDFFLMHLLTAVLLITAILPYISIDKRAMLLKGHFAGVVHQYISRGCPPFNLDFVRNYQPKNKPEEYGSWESLIQYSLEEKDPHLVKTMRALFKAEKTWNLSGKESLYFKIAQLTLDGYRNYYWSL